MKKITVVLAAALLLAGGLVLTYPFWSNWLASRQQGQHIQAYVSQVEGLSEEERAQIWQDAVFYNTNRVSATWLVTPPTPDDTVSEEYLGVLNIEGIMGHLEIPKINVDISIYHGVENEQISTGAGHFPWSDLPIGGEGNHSVLTSHSALASAKLLTDLVDLELGDLFYLHILDQTLAYQVDQTMVVLPDEIEELRPVEGKDLVTLITCTPYAINSHRLLVRGTRIDYVPEEKPSSPVEARATPNWLFLGGVGVLVAGLLVTAGRKQHRKNKEQRRINRSIYMNRRR